MKPVDMTPSNEVQEFPDLTVKLTAPSKKSLFERQKAEAEAKRVREEAETAAVYEDFVKSFEDDDPNDFKSTNPGGRFGGDLPSARAPGGPGKRHFAPGGPRGNSGPGSLGPAASLPRKRPFEQARPSDRERDRGLFAFDDAPPSIHRGATAAFASAEDQDESSADSRAAERAAAKPTLQLSLLPPGTSPAVIKSLLPSKLSVDGVRFIHSGAVPNGVTDRKSASAIVTLAADTPASEIDAAVNALQNRYLGFGFHLSISRHLSSAALGALSTTGQSLHGLSTSLPFGARTINNAPSHSLSRAPPPPGMHRGGFAPPASYETHSGRSHPSAQVHVTAPTNIKQLKLIHKTVEAVLSHGPEFEALLMSRSEVQRGEKWAWLWDARSTGGVWYRWRLWQILSGLAARRVPRSAQSDPPTHRVFDSGAVWMEPEDELPFEFSTRFEALISDSDYNSSDEDDSDADGEERAKRRRMHEAGPGTAGASNPLAAGDAGQSYLKPLHRAKLTHLLARLPVTPAKLRKGDVARVTAFAISHAGSGADEVVDMLAANILRPVACCAAANPEAGTTANGDGPSTPLAEADELSRTVGRKDDTSPATLVALHLVSDILSASSTSGVRHAWRYRALFESTLATRKIFTRLGRFERTFGWGRLRADKWRRSVGAVLTLWEGWCAFSGAAQEGFVGEFERAAEGELDRMRERNREKDRDRDKDGTAGPQASKSRWKSVDGDAAANADRDTLTVGRSDGQAIDGRGTEEDVDGEPMEEEEEDNLDGEAMEEEVGSELGVDVDGGAMEVSEHEAEAVAVSGDAIGMELARDMANVAAKTGAGAEDGDMFADSDHGE